VLVRKIFDDGFAVIADGSQLDALLFKSCDGGLQLDQLPFAVRSPIGGTENQQNSSVRAFQGCERLFFAKLIACGKIGCLLTYVQPNRAEQLQGFKMKRIPVDCSVDGYGVTQMANSRPLRIEAENLPGGIVVKRKCSTRDEFGALLRFGEG
jgi:hypothetical protein